MKAMILTRSGELPDWGMFGVLKSNGFSCKTLERPWLNNEHGISCIPLNQYVCKFQDVTGSHLHKVTGFDHLYEVMDVPGRSGIYIHPANFVEQLEGCIALGDRVGCINGKIGVMNSHDAVEMFHHIMGGEDFLLSIERA